MSRDNSWVSASKYRGAPRTLDVYMPSIYTTDMIKTFKCAETERLFLRESARRLAPDIVKSALRKLLLLNAAKTVEELRLPPGNRLERLCGDRDGAWSIRINDQWRICFLWDGSDAFDVEIVDYH